jgi:hypothetical protein
MTTRTVDATRPAHPGRDQDHRHGQRDHRQQTVRREPEDLLAAGRERIEPVDQAEHAERAQPEAEQHRTDAMEVVEATARIASNLVHVPMVTPVAVFRHLTGVG